MGNIKHISLFLLFVAFFSQVAKAERHGTGSNGGDGSSNNGSGSSNPFSKNIGNFSGSGGSGGGAGGGSGSGGNEAKPSKQLEELSKDLPKQLEENQKTADKALETMKKSAESGQQALSKVMENAAKTAQDGENNKEFKNAIAQITQSISASGKDDAAFSQKFTDDLSKSMADRAQAAIANNKKTLEILSGAPAQAPAPTGNGNLLTAADPNRGNPLAEAIKAGSGKNSIPSFGSDAKGTAISHGGGGNAFVNSYNPPALNK